MYNNTKISIISNYSIINEFCKHHTEFFVSKPLVRIIIHAVMHLTLI